MASDRASRTPRPPAAGASVVTIVRGRLDHLANLVRGLERQEGPVHELVVVQMGGPDPAAAVSARCGPTTVIEMAVEEGAPLPLAAARNRGAEAADGDQLIFLDVDCIPGARLVSALRSGIGGGGRIASAQVQYLPVGSSSGDWVEDDLRRVGAFHPVRPEVTADVALAPELLWTLAIGLARADFDCIGGFDESYVGYGAEDTDFGLRATRDGMDLVMITDAHAYHQHHVTFDPPLQHLDDLAANARRFHGRWSRWPMEGWLAAMADIGVIAWAPDGDDLEVIRRPTADELLAAREGA